MYQFKFELPIFYFNLKKNIKHFYVIKILICYAKTIYFKFMMIIKKIKLL